MHLRDELRDIKWLYSIHTVVGLVPCTLPTYIVILFCIVICRTFCKSLSSSLVVRCFLSVKCVLKRLQSGGSSFLCLWVGSVCSLEGSPLRKTVILIAAMPLFGDEGSGSPMTPWLRKDIGGFIKAVTVL